MASVIANTPVSAALYPIEGHFKWGGQVSYNLLNSNVALEVARMQSSAIDAGKVTSAQGLGSWEAEVIDAIVAISEISGLVFVRDEINADADILIGDFQNNASLGYAFGPAYARHEVAFNTNAPSMLTEAELGGGSERLYTIVHELLHAAGLGHPHDTLHGTTSTGLPPFEQLDPYRATGTALSYDVYSDGPGGGLSFGRPVTPMALDIAALQHMYELGESKTSATTYTLTDPQASPLDLDGSDGTISIGRAYYAIYDSAGVDEIRYSGSNNVLINLNTATLTNSTPADIGAILDLVKQTDTWAGLSSDTQAELDSAGSQAAGFFSSVLVGAYSTPSWARIPRDGGHEFHAKVGTDSTPSWAPLN